MVKKAIELAKPEINALRMIVEAPERYRLRKSDFCDLDGLTEYHKNAFGRLTELGLCQPNDPNDPIFWELTDLGYQVATKLNMITVVEIEG